MRLPPERVRCPGCKDPIGRHCANSRQCNWYPCGRCKHTVEGTWITQSKAGRLGPKRMEYVAKAIHPRLPEGFGS